MYKLTIIKYEDNKNYAEEMAKFKENTSYGRYNYNQDRGLEIPQKELAKNVFEVVLTEDEFKKVKAETIKVFE